MNSTTKTSNKEFVIQSSIQRDPSPNNTSSILKMLSDSLYLGSTADYWMARTCKTLIQLELSLLFLRTIAEIKGVDFVKNDIEFVQRFNSCNRPLPILFNVIDLFKPGFACSLSSGDRLLTINTTHATIALIVGLTIGGITAGSFSYILSNLAKKSQER
jgi:hypothetical protein